MVSVPSRVRIATANGVTSRVDRLVSVPSRVRIATTEERLLGRTGVFPSPHGCVLQHDVDFHRLALNMFPSPHGYVLQHTLEVCMGSYLLFPSPHGYVLQQPLNSFAAIMVDVSVPSRVRIATQRNFPS